MKFLNLLEANGFGVKVLVIGILVAIAELLLKKFCKNRPFLVNYLPLVLAFIGEIITELILNGEVILSEELFYGVVMAYSIGTLFSVWIKKILRGEMNKDELLLLIKSVAKNLCAENDGAVFSQIAKLLRNSELNPQSLKEKIIALLEKSVKDGVSKAEITAATEKILLSAKSIKEK